MYRSLYFKIILIFVVFMITVMAVVGTVLLNSVFIYYNNEFVAQMDEYLSPGSQLREELTAELSGEDFAESQKKILSAYSSRLGIDKYRNFYILDASGVYLAGSQDEPDSGLPVTGNILSAMAGVDGKEQIVGAEFTDYAVALRSYGRTAIIYIKDTQDEMRELSWQLFSIILQSVMFGLVIAVFLSFFLAKAITQPIQELTRGAQNISEGRFSERIEVESKDEIGILTATFNRMGAILKNTLAEVEGERRKLETIFAYLKDGVIAFAEDGSVIHINRSAIEMFGDNYDKDRFNVEYMLSLFHFEFTQAFISEDEEGSSFVWRDVQLGSGRALDVNIGTLRYQDENTEREGIVVVLHDITSRYELDKSRREFVANVSHELRTPLTSIQFAAETLLEYENIPNEMQRQYLGDIVGNCDRMLRIVTDLLTLSRLDNKRTRWKISQFDLRGALEHICEMLSVQANEKNQTITLHGETQNLGITADKERIEQVVINIITNSIKYTPEGGKIDVFVNKNTEKVPEIDGESASIVISDNGVGIPEEDLPRLFERFYRVEKSRTSETGGTGLGLSIAKEITEAHGGKISIASRQGEGTTVTIVLPLKTKLENT